jgi:glycosyltransferase involved in cell wall biosynthesis
LEGDKQKILVFIDWFYPGFRSGGPSRSVWNLIQKMKDKFSFYVVTRNIDYCSETPYLDKVYDEWTEIFEGLNVYYQDHRRLTIQCIRQHIEEIPWDICYINGVYSYYFSIIPLFYARKFRKGKVVVSPRGMLSEGSVSVKSFKKTGFLSISRRLKLFDEVTFHATKENEEMDIHRWFGRCKVVVVPNFPTELYEEKLAFPLKDKGILNLIWLGRISPEKNLLFALKLLRSVRKGQINFFLYGVIYDKEYWKECQQLIDDMPDRVRISYEGVLEPEDIIKTLSRFHFMFLPTTGENYGHAILESMMAGTPVIISNTTPWTQLAEKGLGWDLPLQDTRGFLKVLRDAINMENRQYLDLRKRVLRYREKFLDISQQIKGYNQLFSK